MKIPLRPILASLLATLATGCAVQTATPEEVRAFYEDIAGGKPINQPGEGVDIHGMSMTTVRIVMNDGSACTGETLSSIQILTAAHCVPAGMCVVQVDQYGLVNNVPTATAHKYQSNPTTCDTTWSTSVRPNNVTGVAASDGSFNWTDDKGDFADMAIVTLATPLPAAVQTTGPGLPGGFGDLVTNHTTLWEVGVGDHNAAGDNGTNTMYYVPVELAVTADTGGQFNVKPTNGKQPPCQHGDSGGPVYQKFFGGLTIVGVCHASNNTFFTSIFTSVLWKNNRQWISDQWVTPPAANLIKNGNEIFFPTARPSELEFPWTGPIAAN